MSLLQKYLGVGVEFYAPPDTIYVFLEAFFTANHLTEYEGWPHASTANVMTFIRAQMNVKCMVGGQYEDQKSLIHYCLVFIIECRFFHLVPTSARFLLPSLALPIWILLLFNWYKLTCERQCRDVVQATRVLAKDRTFTATASNLARKPSANVLVTLKMHDGQYDSASK